MLLVIKARLIVALLLWLALGARAGDRRAAAPRHRALSPSVQVLTANLVRIALIVVALMIGLNTVGIDLTAFAVFSGAIGVGLGFGLQKIVSNFVSGIILLLERSIKPGDVIEVGNTFGSVTSLGARYASVLGRDGKEYLIPNENLITNQVVNWSYSSPLVRLDVPFGVAYAATCARCASWRSTPPGASTRVLVDAGAGVPRHRVRRQRGQSAAALLDRRPAKGVTNIKGEVYLALWESFREHGVELPFPQREVHLSRRQPAASLQSIAHDED